MKAMFALAMMATAALSASAKAQDAEALALCEGLERPNIDCACVARTVEQHRVIAPSDAVSDLVIARYAYALGQDGEPVDDAFERVVEDGQGPATMIDMQRAFDQLGGTLESVDEFEGQCVIAGAPGAEPPQPEAGSVAASFAGRCVEAAGVGSARACGCEAVLFEGLAGPDGLEAYLLSFSLYPDDPSEDPAGLRAERMGVSPARFGALEREARSVIAPEQDRVRNYCSAMVWADDARGSSDAERAAIGFDPVTRAEGGGAALRGIESTMAEVEEDSLERARAAEQAGGLDMPNDARTQAALGEAESMSAMSVLQQGCTGSEPYCGCLASRFDQATGGASEGGRMLAAMTLVGDGLDEATAARAARSANATAQAELAQIFPQVMGIPGQCEAEAGASMAADAAAAARRGGDPRERYLAFCEVQQGEAAADACACAADHFDSNLNRDEFDLLIRVQAADLEGQGGFEGFAGDLGMSEAEAGRALASNPRLMQAMMGVQGACMAGGYP
jgi:hypothetical protein